MMEDATDGGSHTSVPRLDTVGSQVRLVTARFAEELGYTESVNTNQAKKIGSWMNATRRRNKGRSHGSAGFSSVLGSHVY